MSAPELTAEQRLEVARFGIHAPEILAELEFDPGYCPLCGMTAPRHTKSCPSKESR